MLVSCLLVPMLFTHHLLVQFTSSSCTCTSPYLANTFQFNQNIIFSRLSSSGMSHGTSSEHVAHNFLMLRKCIYALVFVLNLPLTYPLSSTCKLIFQFNL